MNERIVQTVRTLAEELRTIVQIEVVPTASTGQAAFQTERITFRKLEKLLDATYPTYWSTTPRRRRLAWSTPPPKFGGVKPARPAPEATRACRRSAARATRRHKDWWRASLT